MKIEKFDSLESTNKYCEALDLAQVEDFTCYWALEQTAGIGQRTPSPLRGTPPYQGGELIEELRGTPPCQGGEFNRWEAEPGKNLTFSLVLHPTFLPAERQFKLTEALSLALVDFFSIFNFQFSISIKWPNDIYVSGNKICGTLVSTRLSGNTIASAICGIGFNVNQVAFPDWVPNPTSLALLTGKQYELEPLLQQLLTCIERRYNALRSGLDPEPEYLSHLLNLGSRARYIYKYNNSSPKLGEGDPSETGGEECVITATITGVDPHGRLLLAVDDGRHISCGMKEIALL